ncbi:hypothetical protein PoB_007593300 [Plakobranchus ocellatus]|uniref:Uncharacterized protein n=1 Tax=Plakobranchus ocellatus TaxID=259542 RepID=A0AAV4DYR8_9GAST|nr:hypothetical protein PoB_007593300 [Plakobranchus ocellatus]
MLLKERSIARNWERLLVSTWGQENVMVSTTNGDKTAFVPCDIRRTSSILACLTITDHYSQIHRVKRSKTQNTCTNTFVRGNFPQSLVGGPAWQHQLNPN